MNKNQWVTEEMKVINSAIGHENQGKLIKICLKIMYEAGAVNALKKQMEEEEPLSNCCGAPPASTIVDGDGFCSRCWEHAEFGGEE